EITSAASAGDRQEMTKSNVDKELIRAIAELLNKENLAELEIEQDELRVRVTRAYPNEAPVYASAPQQFYAPPATPATPATPAVPTGSVAAAPAPAEELASNPGTLTWPMVRADYRSPEPGKPAFVGVGTKVSQG